MLSQLMPLPSPSLGDELTFYRIVGNADDLGHETSGSLCQLGVMSKLLHRARGALAHLAQALKPGQIEGQHAKVVQCGSLLVCGHGAGRYQSRMREFPKGRRS